jgi:SAM-dependent methyltransferase
MGLGLSKILQGLQNKLAGTRPADEPAKDLQSLLSTEQQRCAEHYGSAPGHCELCAQDTIFVRHGEWNREQYRCVRCGSIPRWRALYRVLEAQFSQWRDLTMHESSPGGRASDVLQQQCRAYEASHYFPNQPLGTSYRGFRNENLEQLTLADASVDLFISQDVMEHILRPSLALQEIARVLKPGGAHVFTIPWKPHLATFSRVTPTANGMAHHAEAEYHGNPIDKKGSLVITDWGNDTVEIMDAMSGMQTDIVSIERADLGIEGERLEVFVSRKH